MWYCLQVFREMKMPTLCSMKMESVEKWPLNLAFGISLAQSEASQRISPNMACCQVPHKPRMWGSPRLFQAWLICREKKQNGYNSCRKAPNFVTTSKTPNCQIPSFRNSTLWNPSAQIPSFWNSTLWNPVPNSPSTPRAQQQRRLRCNGSVRTECHGANLSLSDPHACVD